MPDTLTLTWQTTRDAFQALNQAVTPWVQSAIEAAGLKGAWGSLMHAYYHDHEPIPISVAAWRPHMPFQHPRLQADNLARLATEGWLTSMGEDAYRLTSQGYQAPRQVHAGLLTGIIEIERRLQVDTARLRQLMGSVYGAIVDAPEPPAKTTMLDYPDFRFAGDSPLAWMRFAVLRIAAYRDDCHHALWMPLGVSGPTWDALTVLWRGEATTVAGVAETLAARGYGLDEYAVALEALIERGWVEVGREPGVYQITDVGRTLRQAVEDQTQCDFFKPWDELSDAGKEEYRVLMAQLYTELQEISQTN